MQEKTKDVELILMGRRVGESEGKVLDGQGKEDAEEARNKGFT